MNIYARWLIARRGQQVVSHFSVLFSLYEMLDVADIFHIVLLATVDLSAIVANGLFIFIILRK